MKWPVHLAFLLALCIGPARAQDASPDGVAARAVIERQMQAFRQDDGAAAFAAAAPSIQRMFGDANTFMGMVRQGYQPVYRPREVVFGALRPSDTGFLQEVRVVGPDDQDYLAVYALERQADGALRIAGCVITRIQGGRA